MGGEELQKSWNSIQSWAKDSNDYDIIKIAKFIETLSIDIESKSSKCKNDKRKFAHTILACMVTTNRFPIINKKPFSKRAS